MRIKLHILIIRCTITTKLLLLTLKTRGYPSILRKCIDKHKATIENMSILKPFSFVLEDDDKETIAELYLVDDETVIIDPDLMEGLDDDLNKFLDDLLKENYSSFVAPN